MWTFSGPHQTRPGFQEIGSAKKGAPCSSAGREFLVPTTWHILGAFSQDVGAVCEQH